jgi:hypothetical protein
MRTVEVLQAALRAAEQAGYQVRHEWLGGSGGGGCEVKGRKLLLLDLALGPQEQLEIVLDALRRDPLVCKEVRSAGFSRLSAKDAA